MSSVEKKKEIKNIFKEKSDEDIDVSSKFPNIRLEMDPTKGSQTERHERQKILKSKKRELLNLLGKPSD